MIESNVGMKQSKLSFTSKNSSFFEELKEKVNHYFTSNDLNPTGNSKLYIKSAILFGLSTLIYVALVFFKLPIWASLFLCVSLGILLAGIGFNIMHDAAHGSYSNKKWLNDLMSYSLNLIGGNVFIWKNKHNVNHHTFTNIEGMDDDIDIEPWIRTNANQPRYWHHRFQHIYWVPLYGVTYLLWIYVNDFKKYFTRKVGPNTPLKKMNFKEHVVFWVSKLLYFSLFLFIPIFKLGLSKTLIGYSVVALTTGFIISVVFQLAHIVEDADFPLPDASSNKMDQEWAIHQVCTTANFSTKNKAISWYTGGLNFQVEHHLFPKISHVHYPKINELVKETCLKFNVKYIEYPTLLRALDSHVSYLKDVGTN